MIRFWHPFMLKNISVRSERGITLVEVLVACALSGIMITFVLYSNLFVNKLVVDWQQKAEIEDVGLLCINSLAKDIREADSLVFVSKDRIELVSDQGKKIAYYVDGSILKRNEDELNHGRIALGDIELVCFGKSADAHSSPKDQELLDKNLNLRLDPDELGEVTGIGIKLKLEGYNKSLSLESFVRLNRAYSIY